MIVEKRLFGGHRFGFYDFFYTVFPCNGRDDFIGLPGVFSGMNFCTGVFRLDFEVFIQFFKILERAVFFRCNLFFYGFKIYPFINCGAIFPIRRVKVVQCRSKELIGKRLFELLFIRFHILGGFNHWESSSRIRICSSWGPWTPMASTLSMSAVLLAPVMNA